MLSIRGKVGGKVASYRREWGKGEEREWVWGMGMWKQGERKCGREGVGLGNGDVGK